MLNRLLIHSAHFVGSWSIRVRRWIAERNSYFHFFPIYLTTFKQFVQIVSRIRKAILKTCIFARLDENGIFLAYTSCQVPDPR